MATEKQKLGEWGELQVVKYCLCPKCKREKTLKRLPPNFKCADIVCDFCGFLGQVKSKNVAEVEKLPKTVLGAAWGPQKERMDAGIYFPLFLVLVNKKNQKECAIYYLSADLQLPSIFIKRKKLSENAKRAGWQGYYYDISQVQERLIRIA